MRRGWWNEECRRGKKEIRRKLRIWRKEGESGIKYREKRSKYKRLCERKKMEEVKRWEREVKEMRMETQVWEIIDKERKKGKGANETIEMEEWDGYFRRLREKWNGGSKKDVQGR